MNELYVNPIRRFSKNWEHTQTHTHHTGCLTHCCSEILFSSLIFPYCPRIFHLMDLSLSVKWQLFHLMFFFINEKEEKKNENSSKIESGILINPSRQFEWNLENVFSSSIHFSSRDNAMRSIHIICLLHKCGNKIEKIVVFTSKCNLIDVEKKKNWRRERRGLNTKIKSQSFFFFVPVRQIFTWTKYSYYLLHLILIASITHEMIQ